MVEQIWINAKFDDTPIHLEHIYFEQFGFQYVSPTMELRFF